MGERKSQLTFLAMVVFASIALRPASSAAADKWISGFYVGYQAALYPPSAIDYSALTHVMVFAALPRVDGTLDTRLFSDPITGPKIAKEIAQRAHAAGKKAILTVGGTDTEEAFRGATRRENIALFIRNIVQTLVAWDFDGVDIDWEPLREPDYGTVLLLVRELRAARPNVVITTDVGWQPRNRPLSAAGAKFYAALASTVDQMNAMTYAMADNWFGWVTWHSSAISGDGPTHPSSLDSTVAQYAAAGVPASKLGIGIGFFGSCWTSPVMAPLQSTIGSRVVAGDNDISFSNIKNLYYRKSNYRFDAAAQAPYLSFLVPTGPKRCTMISYEDEASIAAKGAYAEKAGLGGALIWQLNEGFDPGSLDPNSLLHAVGRAFMPRKPKPAIERSR